MYPNVEDFRDKSAMNGAELCKRLVNDFKRANGLPVSLAREGVASAIGVSPGTLENLERGRLKFKYHEVVSRLNSYLIRQLERKMQEIETEIYVARMSSELVSPDVLGAENALKAARECLNARKERL